MSALTLFEQLGEIPVADIRKRMEAVPFGHSTFQNIYLADDAQTPERKVRYVLLQLNAKLNALKECEFRRRRLDIDLRELRQKLTVHQGFELERTQISIEEKEWGLQNEEKLIRDALVEVATFVAMLEKLPKVETREQFEKAEGLHWQEKFARLADTELRSVGVISTGTLDAIAKIGGQVQCSERGGPMRIVFNPEHPAALADEMKEIGNG